VQAKLSVSNRPPHLARQLQISVTVHKSIVSHGSTTAAAHLHPPGGRQGGSQEGFHLVAAFDFHRQIVFNATDAEYDRIDASTPSQCSVQS
jgi:hypothetical protein